MEIVNGTTILSLAINMFSRCSSLLTPCTLAMAPLLLLTPLYPSRGKELHVATSAEDSHLIARIKALSPTVSLNDAQRVTYCAITTGQELAREWHVPGVASWLPGIQNFLIHIGKREGGYCFQYSTELLRRLDALKLQTVEFHWAESEPNRLAENNAIVVKAR